MKTVTVAPISNYAPIPIDPCWNISSIPKKQTKPFEAKYVAVAKKQFSNLDQPLCAARHPGTTVATTRVCRLSVY